MTSVLWCKLWLSCTVAISRSISFTVCIAVSNHGVQLIGYTARQLLLLPPLYLGYLSQAVLWPDMARLTALAGPIPYQFGCISIMAQLASGRAGSSCWSPAPPPPTPPPPPPPPPHCQRYIDPSYHSQIVNDLQANICLQLHDAVTVS